MLDTQDIVTKLKNFYSSSITGIEISESLVNQFIDKVDLDPMLKSIAELARSNQIDVEDIESARIVKLATRGGFDKRIYLEWFALQKTNPLISPYLANPHKYKVLGEIAYYYNGPVDSVMFACNKMVRHKMSRIADLNYKMCYYRLGDEEFEAALCAKLHEEAIEVLEAKNAKELTEELGDFLEICGAYFRYKQQK